MLDHFPKLKTLMDRKGGNLSGGERQMLLMAQSLLGKPDLVLMWMSPPKGWHRISLMI